MRAKNNFVSNEKLSEQFQEFQNGISRLYNMLEIHHSGPEPSICNTVPNAGFQQTACVM